jgi:ABC-2 type transport system ATP-binding protein
MNDAIVIEELTHVYPQTRRRSEPRTALAALRLTVSAGELFAVLGPNGSGKSTLFRILSTLVQASSGTARILGADLRTEPGRVRRMLGVVFQHPSLDGKLTVQENLFHQGHLYGLSGSELDRRIGETLSLVGLVDRADDIVDTLSGGMQRRAELAKSLLHKPPVLLLDEPSTGLDPGARKDFIGYLEHLRASEGTTILLTTHILDEADRCGRIAILDNGALVALGTPSELKQEIGGEVITLATNDAEILAGEIAKHSGAPAQAIGNFVRIERKHAHEYIPQLVEAFPGRIDSVTLSRPTLEDVFIHRTGHRFWEPGT